MITSSATSRIGKKYPARDIKTYQPTTGKGGKKKEWFLALAHHSLDLSSIKIESAAYQSLKKGKQNEGGSLLP